MRMRDEDGDKDGDEDEDQEEGGMTCSSEPEEHGALNQPHNLFHCS